MAPEQRGQRREEVKRKQLREEAEMSRAADLKWEFAEIPSGEYWMGASDGDEEASRDKKPRHRVRLSRSFELGRFPVTQAMWESVMV